MRLGTTILLLATVLVPAQDIGFTQSCDCDGSSSDKFLGGDQHPLTWLSTKLLVPNSNPSKYCYARKVRNHGTDAVTEVNWEIADFYKGVLPQGAICDITQLESTPDHPPGLLYYGPGPTKYGTQVWAPSGGWPKESAVHLEHTGAAGELDSTIQFAYRDGAEYSIASFKFSSRVLPKGSDVLYQYKMNTDAKRPVRVAFLLPDASDEFWRDTGLRNSVLVAANNAQILREAFSQRRVGIVCMRVTITQEGEKRDLSRSVVSLYTPLTNLR